MLNNVSHSQAETGRLFVALVCLLWVSVIASRADTHYVSLDGTNDSGNGYITWSGAATNIQWAVDKAAASGDTVLVSNGTYNLTNYINISKSVTVRSLYGTNDINTSSIINGNNYVGKEVTNKCVYMGATATIHPVLDGFIITNGYFIVTNGTTNPRRGGGGVEMMNGGELYNCFIGWNTVSVETNGQNNGGGGIYANPSLGYTAITNCAIASNTVLNTGSGDRNGGGFLSVYNLCTVSACRVYGNYAINGGGMYFSSSMTVSNCTVYDNTAESSGGGIYAGNGSTVANCVISNNVTTGGAGTGGGIYYLYPGIFMNSVIIGNRSRGVGGVELTHGSSMSNCQVIANISTNSGASGVTASGLPSVGNGVCGITDCVIAYNLGKSGPGLSSTGQATISNLVRNCLIYGNTNLGANGGGVAISLMGRYPFGLINCTIANNEAGTLGGGLYTTTYSNYIANCIIYGNVTTGDNNDEVYVATVAGTNNFWYNCAPTNLVAGQGNTTNNPRFIDAGNRNYRPGSGSPCVNTGTNMDWMTNSAAIDLDKRIRIRYGTVDMGAYEAIYNGTMYGVR